MAAQENTSFNQTVSKEMFSFCCRESKRKGMTLQAYIRLLIAEEKERKENPLINK